MSGTIFSKGLAVFPPNFLPTWRPIWEWKGETHLLDLSLVILRPEVVVRHIWRKWKGGIACWYWLFGEVG